MTPKEKADELKVKYGILAEKVTQDIISLQVWTNPQTTENLSFWNQVLTELKPPSTGNKAPVARAGADQVITLPTNSVKLDGSLSTDPEGGALKYYWRKLSGPTVTLTDTTKAIATASYLVKGIYVFELRVVDQFNAWTWDTVKVTVQDSVVIPNIPPVVSAGINESITLPVNSLTLVGEATDTDGTIASYQWSKISGPSQFTIQSPTQAQTLISNLIAGTYTFELKATDNGGATASDTVQVIVNAEVVIPPGNNFFASPTGTGNGSSQSSPFKISSFWAVAKPGSVLNLMDGKYTGASGMIKPPSGLSGISGNPITIRAINDGKVDIDGQGQFAPVSLENNNWWVLEGFNAHHAGSSATSGDGWSVTVVTIKNSSNNILRRICAWEARDGNTNIFGFHGGTNCLMEDCAGWGTARKIFSNSQQGNKLTLRRCFARWEGSHTEGPKHAFALSYNSYDAVAENCVGTWDGLKMKQSYALLNYNNQPASSGIQYSNYTVHAPQGMFSHDGFDVLPDVANIKLYGCIGFLKASQRWHNLTTRKWAAPFCYDIKGVLIQNCLSYIEPGSRTDNLNVNLGSSQGTQATQIINGLTQIGGQLSGNIGSNWSKTNVVSQTTCGTIQTGSLITKRTVNGVQTNEDLWPWPMNQRIIDAMTQGGYAAPLDVTKTVFELCGTAPPTIPPTGNIVDKAKQWLAATPTQRPALEAELSAYKTGIDEVIAQLKPKPTKTATGEIFFQNIPKYTGHQYHMYVPAHYKPATPFGLIVWLHAGGSYDTGGIQHLADFDMSAVRAYARTETDTSNYILVAPIGPFGEYLPHPQHASRWDVPGSDQYIMDVITEVSTHYNVDFNKVVIAGFSMGGIGAFHMALRLSDRVAAVMASGGGWSHGSWASLVSPLYIIQGVKDAYFNSPTDCRNHNTAIEYSRLIKQIMGANCELKEYPGGHGWDSTGEAAWRNFINGQTGWVTTKVRNPYRPNVTALNPWRSYDVGSNFNVTWTEKESPHTLWVTIKEIGTGTIAYDQAKKSGTGGCSSATDFNSWSLALASVNLKGGKVGAQITGPNAINVTTANVKRFSLWLHPSMCDLSKQITVTVNGAAREFICGTSLLKALQSYERRWDWSMIYHGEIEITL